MNGQRCRKNSAQSNLIHWNPEVLHHKLDIVQTPRLDGPTQGFSGRNGTQTHTGTAVGLDLWGERIGARLYDRWPAAAG